MNNEPPNPSPITEGHRQERAANYRTAVDDYFPFAPRQGTPPATMDRPRDRSHEFRSLSRIALVISIIGLLLSVAGATLIQTGFASAQLGEVLHRSGLAVIGIGACIYFVALRRR